MAWIKVVDEEEAPPELEQAYAALRGSRGKVANIMKAHSLNPKAMLAHMSFYTALLFGPSGLRREERELIAVAVSTANGCDYCVKHHAEALEHYRDHAKVARVVEDYRSADLSSRSHAMLDYAVKVTKTPEAMCEDDVETLRNAGFADDDILNINLIAAYFNFVNRVALGLGVNATAAEVAGYRY